MEEARRVQDVKLTARASVTWPEPKPEEQAPPEQVEAVNEQEQED